MAAAHTPGPWCTGHMGTDGLWVGPSHDVRPVAVVPWDCDGARDEARANARLIAAAPELLEALTWSEQFDPRTGEGANERFERIAEVFHWETGYLRPGKDCRMHSIEERQQAWDAWVEAGRARCRAAIAKATGAAS